MWSFIVLKMSRLFSISLEKGGKQRKKESIEVHLIGTCAMWVSNYSYPITKSCN